MRNTAAKATRHRERMLERLEKLAKPCSTGDFNSRIRAFRVLKREAKYQREAWIDSWSRNCIDNIVIGAEETIDRLGYGVVA